MKVSLNWLKELTSVTLTTDDLVAKIGSQLGGVDEVIDLSKKYQGIIVAKVVECVKHPDADKLSLCKIDDGGRAANVERDENGHVQVVCGAPNVREGLMVAWLPPGSTVPSSFEKDPFVLEARELRGKISNGMLASAQELAISDDHGGIMELSDVKPGDDLAEAFQLDDHIIDIENKMFTHRPDCFGMLGVAREIAGIQQEAFKSPDWYRNNSVTGATDEAIKGFDVEVQIPELVPRYMAVVMTGIKVVQSPFWLQAKLSRIGIRPINNIVDMTNYMMYLTGQPLHAFDFDKVAVDGHAKIVVRKPNEGEKITLLDGKEISPRKDAVLICDTEKPIALGGVMGGNNSEIDEHTTRIIIESANFDMYNIRRTSMEHGIFTDAVTRFNKGQSEWQCQPVLYRAVQMTIEMNQTAKMIGQPVDVHTVKRQNTMVITTAEFINDRLGLKLSVSDIMRLLTNVEFEVNENGENVEFIAPFWRTDIEIPEDIVEEVGRLYGYDRLPLDLPKRNIKPATRNRLLELKSNLRDVLADSGANEALTYSFIHGDLIAKTGQELNSAFGLANALSPDLQYYRMSLTPSLLEKVHANLKSDMPRGDDNEFAIFEIGKAHIKGMQDKNEPKLPGELNVLALVFAADDKTAARKYHSSPYYIAGKYLATVLKRLKFNNVELVAYDHELAEPEGRMLCAPFEPLRSAFIKINGEVFGIIGEYKASVRQKLKLPEFSAGFELDIDYILKSHLSTNYYGASPKFPKVQQDMTLKVSSSVMFGELQDALTEKLVKNTPKDLSWELGTVDIYQSEEDKDHKNLTFRLWISSFDKTLKAEEVNRLLDDLAEAAHEKFGAERL